MLIITSIDETIANLEKDGFYIEFDAIKYHHNSVFFFKNSIFIAKYIANLEEFTQIQGFCNQWSIEIIDENKKLI